MRFFSWDTGGFAGLGGHTSECPNPRCNRNVTSRVWACLGFIRATCCKNAAELNYFRLSPHFTAFLPLRSSLLRTS